MEKIKYHNKYQEAVHDRSSPRLIRSRSASPAVNIFGGNSKSTAAKKKNSRRVDDYEQIKSNSIYNTTQKKLGVRDDSHDRVLRQSKIQQPGRARSACSSPSSWALSPGRLSHPHPPPVQVIPVVPTMTTTSPIATATLKKSSKGKGVSGVLNYFRMKRISPLLEEEYHQFRIMHNRLLQWRFANARAEISMAAAKRKAEKKLFNVWAKITLLRKLVVENRIQMQRLKQEIKLLQIMGLQMHLLKEWGGKLENKNFEAVGRLTRKLSAISICLPLAQDCKVDTESLRSTMDTAMRIMESVEGAIRPIQSQAEKLCYLLTELSIVMKEQADNVNNLAELLAKIAYLEATERSLKVQLVQLQ